MFVSFAQNFEDVILNRIFRDKAIGFYVDIGAYHPTIGSVTRHFYDRGWNGINVEPGPVFRDLAAARPRDTNLNLAVLDYAGKAYFVEDAKDPGSSFVATKPSEASRPVACDTLTNIIATHAKGKAIDFLKIDVEGAERAIMESTDWRAVRPTIMVIEAVQPWTNDLVNQDWEPLLLAAGYSRMYFDGINCFYATSEAAGELKALFAAPINVLDDFVPYHLIEQINRTAHDNKPAPAPTPLPKARSVADSVSPKKAPSSPQPRVQGPRRRTVRGAMLGLVRPIVRPVLRRWRKFLAAPMLDAAGRSEAANAKLAKRLEAIARTQAALHEAIARSDAATRETLERMEALNREAIARSDASNRDAVTRTDRANQAMATVVADAMLTAAIDAARHTVPHIDVVERATESMTTLTLPHGLEARIAFADADESVGGPIAGSGGLWEPHIQRFFERNVAADCCFLDIGANIGVHSLNVASLAPDGQVIAFEAHPRTFEFLARNLATRSGFARMGAVHAALWDKPARLQIAGAAELVGSSFLVPNQSEASTAELKLRAANPSALRDRQMHVAAFEIDAVTLDSWVDANQPPRVDLIKMDVEGAEARVIEGARELIARYRPTLVVEYNPACAINYFGETPDRLFHLLQELFATIGLIEADGEPTPLATWDELARRLAAGKGWEDLACGS